jgi:hypothetical protein
VLKVVVEEPKGEIQAGKVTRDMIVVLEWNGSLAKLHGEPYDTPEQEANRRWFWCVLDNSTNSIGPKYASIQEAIADQQKRMGSEVFVLDNLHELAKWIEENGRD